MLQIVEHLSSTGGHVVDLTTKGWIASRSYIELLSEKLLDLDGNYEKIVLDLFSNIG